MNPLNHIMVITQSQVMKPVNPDSTLRHVHQEQGIIDQHLKAKESVIKIPEEQNDTEQMDTIKQGLDSNQQEFHSEKRDLQSNENVPEKEILDEDHGNNIDFLC